MYITIEISSPEQIRYNLRAQRKVCDDERLDAVDRGAIDSTLSLLKGIEYQIEKRKF